MVEASADENVLRDAPTLSAEEVEIELEKLKPSRDKEHPPDDLDRKTEENWARVPEGTRQRCAEHLRRSVQPELLAKWRDQLERGMAIGSDTGMAVRNALRAVLPDEKLPGVDYGDGSEYSNWDDFYTAALREAVGG
jgi:hypothetical protein